MMKKLLISLLSVGMLLGGFGIAGNISGVPNAMEQTVQADTNDNNTQTINYEVDDENTSTRSVVNPYFTNNATITKNSDGTYKVTLTARVSHLSGVTGLNVPKIDNQTPTISATYLKLGKRYEDISFQINDLDELNSALPGTVQTKLGPISVDEVPVDFKFDPSTLAVKGNHSSLADSLNSLTDAQKKIDSDLSNAKDAIDTFNNNVAADANNHKVIVAPTTTDSGTNTNNTTTSNNNDETDPTKTVLKDLTYKIAKNNGDGALISPYFTNTAKVMQNPDGTYYVEVTMKYPKKFGNKAIQVNYVNNNRPSNMTFTSEGDSNYLKFDFPIKKLTDLSNLIPGDISLNLPDFGLNKDLGFNFDFGSLNTSDLAKTLDNSDISGLLSDLSSLTKPSSLKTTSSPSTADNKDKDKYTASTLPQTGDQANGALTLIGGLILVLWLILLKGTYLKR